MADDPWRSQADALGQFIHAQRKLAKLSLRELAALTDLSNAYLSQLERGLHQPSIRVVNSIAKGLGVSAEQLLERAGLFAEEERSKDGPKEGAVEAALRADPALNDEQRQALLAIYRSFVREASQG